MSGFDANRIYSVSVHEPPAPTAPESASETEKLLLDFLLQYRVGGEFIYRYSLHSRLWPSLTKRVSTGTPFGPIYYSNNTN
jgi:DNA replication licensing factor MCM5